MSAARTSSTARKGAANRPARGAGVSDLLLELGTEELPFQFIAPACRSLVDAATRRLKEQRLEVRAVRSLATPRRLALLVDGMAQHQATAMMEIMGPPKRAAFDATGAPTKAALGFAASQGVPVTALEVRALPKGEYLFAVKQEPGRPVLEVLPDLLRAVIGDLAFPKAMKWDSSGFRFARPLRWIVALYGKKVVPLEIAGVRSGNRTYGHRVLAGKQAAKGVTVSDAGAYDRILEQAGVIVDPVRRRMSIEEQMKVLADEASGLWRADEGLIEQAVYAVEHPRVIRGGFAANYLELPPDVIETAMREHQGFFALRRASGELLPQFLAVVNNACRDMSLIRKGNERVLAARLSDAAFYFNDDQKEPLAERAARLGTVVFHQRLGTMGQKAERLEALAGWLADSLGEAALIEPARRAARLSKADLLTGVVGEFPALQGIMGGVYAERHGETADIAAAIRDQYLPRGMDGPIPETLVGKIVSLADRLDNLAAFFAAGLTPKGSEDPFALRRHALSLVRVVLEGQLSLDLRAAVAQATQLVQPHVKAGSVAADPLPFILERFRYYVSTASHVRADLIEAATGRSESWPQIDVRDRMARILALQGIAGQVAFDPLIVGFKRAHRLVDKEQWVREDVQAELFQHPAERELHQALMAIKEPLRQGLEQRRYTDVLGALVGLKPQIDAFFEGVMVNAEDPRLRANRLSLLRIVDQLFLSFADFSVVLEQGAAGG